MNISMLRCKTNDNNVVWFTSLEGFSDGFFMVNDSLIVINYGRKILTTFHFAMLMIEPTIIIFRYNLNTLVAEECVQKLYIAILP